MSVALSLKSKKESNRRKLMFRTEAMEAAAELELDDIDFGKAVELYKLDCFDCKLHDSANPKSVNCRDNPYCIQRLGLERFHKLLKDEQQRNDKVIKDQKRRDAEEKPCGLVNTGNYCYVNSFLQIWFNDPGFRQIIYDWRPSPCYVRPNPPFMDVERVMNSLQHLFFTLQYTPYNSTNENSAFINSLRLDNEQQDAQEFTLMMFDALDRNLSKHPNGNPIREAIKERFTGMIRQRLFCNCREKDDSSETPFTSIQLIIGENKTLTSALQAYLSPEVLEDYRCNKCNKRGNVKRQSSIEKLPDVLMLQLTRYVYDATGRRKLKTPISYPREFSADLIMPVLKKEEVFTYELFAVMIHEGDNAHFGHYYDLVKNPTNGNWYRYDDEKVEKVKPPGCTSPPPQRPPIDMKAWYGLLYRKKQETVPFVIPPPEICSEWQAKMEKTFCGQTETEVRKSELRVTEVRDRLNSLQTLLDSLKAHADKFRKPRDIAFLPISLLSDILLKEFQRAESITESIAELTPNNTDENDSGSDSEKRKKKQKSTSFTIPREQIAHLLEKHTLSLCTHGLVDIDSVLFGEVKAVSRLYAETLLTRYAISVHRIDGSTERAKLLTGADICVECCKQLKREAHFNKQLGNGVKLASKILKDKTRCSLSKTVKPENYLYVSRKCLQNYRKLATKEMEYQHRLQETTSVLLFAANNVDGRVSPNLPTEEYTSEYVKKAPGRPRKRPISISTSYDQPEKILRGTESCNGDEKSENEKDFAEDEDVVILTKSSASENEGDMEIDTNTKDSTSSNSVILMKSADGSRENSEKRAASPSFAASCSFDSSSEGGQVHFNDLLRCPHDSVNVSEYRMAVSPEEWQELTLLFSSSVPILCSDEICDECVQLEVDAQTEKEKAESQVKLYGTRFNEILRKIDRRKPLDEEYGTIYNRGICSFFLTKLRATFRRSKDVELPKLCQEHVLCQHGLPYKKIGEFNGEKQDTHVIPLTDEEWQAFCEAWNTIWPGAKFKEIRIEEEGKIAQFCQSCAGFDEEAQTQLLYQYINSPIYVKLQNDCDDSTAPVETKSTRRVQSKNYLKIKMSGDDTIMDLKIKLYKKTGQSPNDQLLYSAVGGSLLDDTTTLSQARILPNNHSNPLILITQSYPASPSKCDSEPRAPERGFLDTALAH